jgi:hypothetical protein
MGGVVKAISKPAAIIANPMIGLNALGGSKAAGALGINLDDEQGAYATPEQKAMQAKRDFLGNYSGEMKDAEKGVQEGAFTKSLFGEGGVQSQLTKEGADLASRGYSLQPQDYEAYGQTAGDVSRLFGQQEQSAAASLARRGLGSGASGAAGAAFSGIKGNKNEMLAQAQTQIAQKRMADTNQRLMQNRALQSQLASQGVNMQRDRFGDRRRNVDEGVSLERQMNEENRQTLSDQQAAVKPGLFSTIGQGLQRGIGQMAQAAPGMLAGGLGGTLASSGANPLATKGKYGVDGAGGTTKMSTDYLNMRE